MSSKATTKIAANQAGRREAGTGTARRRALAALLLAAAALAAKAQDTVWFDWFEYVGRDAAFDAALPPGGYRNPVLAGFHPDPAITRAGDKFYLVVSTFTFFPGIPVFESTDLVHWKQVGNVIGRASQLDFDGLSVSRGVFAPSIAFHDGTFYVLNTAVDSGGNYLATATDPAGPWSDPIWLKSIDGIDPSLFFDDDGKVYLLNNGPPEGTPLYEGHRAIWMQQFDLTKREPFGPRQVLINGGVDFSKKPIWIEGPHIYKRNGWYYLVCAEGGTSLQHSQVVLRSHAVWGPYEPYAHNPILTQRDLAPDRADAIINAGHADLVEAKDGTWWAIFLASRAYGRTHYNTGRETFLLPVEWKDDWPTILAPGRPIPQVAVGPTFALRDADQAPQSGNFVWRDEFDAPKLDPAWMFVRVPKRPWAELGAPAGTLAIHPLTEGLDTLRNPSFLGRRQQHLAFDASTALMVPARPGVAAGLAAFQDERHWYFLGVRRRAGRMEVFLEKDGGDAPSTIAKTALTPAARLRLKIAAERGAYSFSYDADGKGWRSLRRNDDGTILSTDVAGGFVGATLGPYARVETAR
jgi:alpha-N-arabinofuranosidase